MIYGRSYLNRKGITMNAANNTAAAPEAAEATTETEPKKKSVWKSVAAFGGLVVVAGAVGYGVYRLVTAGETAVVVDPEKTADTVAHMLGMADGSVTSLDSIEVVVSNLKL